MLSGESPGPDQYLNPRIGCMQLLIPRIKTPSHQGIAVCVGATYLCAEVDLAGRVALDTPGGPAGDLTTIDFRVSQKNKDRWNYLPGFSWDLNKNWSILDEAGFGGSWENPISGVTYPF